LNTNGKAENGSMKRGRRCVFLLKNEAVREVGCEKS